MKADGTPVPAAGAGRAASRSEPAEGRLAVVFEILRGRPAGWAIFGFAAGTLLLVLMGAVAQWIGAILLVIGAWNAWSLVRTYLFPAGQIVVDDDGVTLPRGQCTKAFDRMPLGDVTAAYFLRRSVPWTRAAPVLVIEAAGKAYAYPRDWFVNEAEQRQVIHAIRRIKPEAVAGVSTTPARREEPEVRIKQPPRIL